MRGAAAPGVRHGSEPRLTGGARNGHIPRARVHRGRRERRFRACNRQPVDAVSERPGATVRPGDAILRQHAPVDRQLLHDDRGGHHRERRRLREDRLHGQRRAAADRGREDVEVVRGRPTLRGIRRVR